MEPFNKILNSLRTALHGDFDSLRGFNRARISPFAGSSGCSESFGPLGNNLDLSFGEVPAEGLFRELGRRMTVGSHECAGPVSSMVVELGYSFWLSFKKRRPQVQSVFIEP